MLDWTPAQWIKLLDAFYNYGWGVLGLVAGLSAWYIWCKWGKRPPPA